MLFQPFGDFLNVDERNIPNAPLDPAVVGPMEFTAFRSFFLADSLCLANAANRSTKADPDVEGHWPSSWAFDSQCVHSR